jgi:DNA-binding CsgD family transcriptional regulator
VERLSRKELSALLEFLQATYALRDKEAFISHVLTALRTLIPSDITSYTELNSETRQSSLWLVEPSDAATSEDQRIFEQYASEQPLIASYLRSQDGGAFKNSDFLTQPQFHRTGLYNEFYRRVGMEHTMAIHLPAASSLVIGIALHRSLTDFSERDRLLLNRLHPHLSEAYHNTQAVSRMHEELTLLRRGFEVDHQGMVVLSKTGRVRLLTPRAQQWLEGYFGGPSADRLPKRLEEWVRQQDATLGRLDTVPPPRKSLIVEREGRRLIVRHLCEAEHCCLLLHEQCSGLSPQFVKRYQLSPQEAKVFEWVVSGKTNWEIGRILHLSVRTVEAYLGSVYEKLGVENRFAAIHLALTFVEGV